MITKYFSQFELIHVIGITNQIESNNRLCDFLQQSNQRKNCNKSYCNFFAYELNYLLHVHTCVNNFESLLLPYMNGFLFKFLLYQCNWMYQKNDILKFIIFVWKIFFHVQLCCIWIDYLCCVNLFWIFFILKLCGTLVNLIKNVLWHFVWIKV